LPGCKSMQFCLEPQTSLPRGGQAHLEVDTLVGSTAAVRTPSVTQRGRCSTWGGGDSGAGGAGGGGSLLAPERSHVLSRTPSPPSPSSPCSSGSTNKASATVAWSDEHQDELQTPRGPMALLGTVAGTLEYVHQAAKPWQPGPVWGSGMEAKDPSAMMALAAVAGAPPPPRPPGTFVRPSKAAMQATPSPTASNGTLPTLVSLGSVGHPRTCAEACKFARKGRGCKDGASCVRCHQCEWRRHLSKPGVTPVKKAK